MYMKAYNPFDVAQQRFDRVAELLDLDEATRSLLRVPMREYHFSIPVRMDDGTEFTARPGDVTSLPKGHDAWVVGDEPVILVDWYGASNYAKG